MEKKFITEEEINQEFGVPYKNGTSNHMIRHNFFKNIHTEIQAYLLGFIYSDGNISKDRYFLGIHVTESDKWIIDIFMKFISSDAKIYKHKGNIFTSRNKQYQSNPAIKLQIGSSILVKDLENLGLTDRKSWEELHIPNIPKNLIKYFILGYFDGDGCFTGHIAPPNVKNREKNPRLRVCWQIDSKRDEILKDFKHFLEKEIKDITLNINYIKRDDMYRICTSSVKACKKLFEYFYKEANFYYQRKYDKFNYYVNTEKAQLITDFCNAQEVNVNESNNPPKSTEHLKLVNSNKDENMC